MKCSETEKKKYLEVKRRKLKQPKLLQVSVLGSGPPAAKNRHGKNRNCTDWRKSPGAEPSAAEPGHSSLWLLTGKAPSIAARKGIKCDPPSQSHPKLVTNLYH